MRVEKRAQNRSSLNTESYLNYESILKRYMLISVRLLDNLLLLGGEHRSKLTSVEMKYCGNGVVVEKTRRDRIKNERTREGSRFERKKKTY